MRLINVATLALEEFLDSDIPKYACLSHRWSSQEVSLQNWQASKNGLNDRVGYSKIIGACRVAEIAHIQYLWADTCCIDKTNSTELAEAINSMWKWYMNCALCIVYLSDVDDTASRDYEGRFLDLLEGESKFADSQWFKRAWTLQELIAPGNLTFYNSSWDELGSKKELLVKIEAVTNIAQAALVSFNPEDWSVAQRMSWASFRKSTRLEDVAYSLLGIFDVNMPLLYGEGSKAFIRLQQEILASAIDTSILAWDIRPGDNFSGELLAPSPANFASCGDVAAFDLEFRGQAMEEEVSLLSPIGISNLGIDIEVMLSPWRMNVFLAYIARHNEAADRKSEPCFMVLKRVGNDNLMKRCVIKSNITLKPTESERRDIQGFEKRRVLITFKDYEQTTVTFNGMQIASSDGLLGRSSPNAPYEHIWPAGTWQKDRILLGEGIRSYGTVAVSVVAPNPTSVVMILLGFDRDYNPMCLLFEENAEKYHTILRRDAKALNPQLINSRWTWKRWDDNDRVHLRTTYKWLDLGRGESVYKSIDRQGFVADRNPHVNVRFHKRNSTWVVDIHRSESRLNRVPEDANDVAHVLKTYRASLQRRWLDKSRASRQHHFVVPAENCAALTPHVVDYSKLLAEHTVLGQATLSNGPQPVNDKDHLSDPQSLASRRQVVNSGIYPMGQIMSPPQPSGKLYQSGRSLPSNTQSDPGQLSHIQTNSTSLQSGIAYEQELRRLNGRPRPVDWISELEGHEVAFQPLPTNHADAPST